MSKRYTKRRLTRLLAFGHLMLAIGLFAHATVLSAQQEDSTGKVVDSFTQSEEEKSAQAVEDALERKRTEKSDEFLDNIRAELKASHRDLATVSHNIMEAEKHIGHAHEQVMTLAEQLENMNSSIKAKETLIANVSVQITEKENGLTLLQKDTKMREVEMAHQKQMLLDYLRVLYERESAVSDTMTGNETINVTKLLLGDESAGDQLQQIRYFDILEDQGQQMFDQLAGMKAELEEAQERVEGEREALSELKVRLSEERNQLEMQRRAKEKLLERTKGEESIYQDLLNETKKQHDEVQEEIAALRQNIEFVEERMELLGDKFDPEDYRFLFDRDTTSVYAYINATKDDDSDFVLGWPVDPSRGITAYFRDSSYASYFGVPHNAIDVRANQETPIRAPADGVVYKVADNGMGYSYLMLAHKGGYMTLYGHVSTFFVAAGEQVTAGQTVALTGGMPGTKGAGLMTTGPHLHFEVLKAGQHVDPLNYLVREFIDWESLPEKYTKEKVKRAGTSPKGFAVPEESF